MITRLAFQLTFETTDRLTIISYSGAYYSRQCIDFEFSTAVNYNIIINWFEFATGVSVTLLITSNVTLLTDLHKTESQF